MAVGLVSLSLATSCEASVGERPRAVKLLVREEGRGALDGGRGVDCVALVVDTDLGVGLDVKRDEVISVDGFKTEEGVALDINRGRFEGRAGV